MNTSIALQWGNRIALRLAVLDTWLVDCNHAAGLTNPQLSEATERGGGLMNPCCDRDG